MVNLIYKAVIRSVYWQRIKFWTELILLNLWRYVNIWWWIDWHFKTSLLSDRASLVAQMVKNLPAMLEALVWSLGREDPLEKEMATLSQYSCLENSVDREAWWTTVHGVPKSWTWLSDFTNICSERQWICHIWQRWNHIQNKCFLWSLIVESNAILIFINGFIFIQTDVQTNIVRVFWCTPWSWIQLLW